MSSNKKRVLPDWLKTGFSADAPMKKCSVQLVKIQCTEISTQIKTITENNSHTGMKEQTSTLSVKRYQTRSSVFEKQNTERVDEKKAILQKPVFIKYKGRIEYHTELHDIAFHSDQLLNWVNQQTTDEVIPIAFDMEWPFSFATGPGRTAVIQLCANVEICYVFHVYNLKRLPTALSVLLTHSKVCLHGVNIKNDFRKLERDFPEMKVQKMIEQCVDLSTQCNKVMNTGGRWSLDRLSSFILSKKVNKDKTVRMSKWHITPLSQAQILYAAIDVYVSQIIYEKLQETENKKENEAKKFIEEFGTEALKAIRQLQ